MDEIKLVYLPVDQLKPYDRNARKHSAHDIEAIKESIRQSGGFNDPIGIWGKKNLIVEGHGRLIAAKELGMKEVPCIRLDYMTEEQRQKYALLHNQTALLSEWDYDILKLELNELDFDDFDFEFGIEDEPEESTGHDTSEDDTPDIPEEPKTKVGDMFQLGNHRLICGDSTDSSVLERLMGGVKAELLLTDPPYGVKIVRGKTIGGDKPFGSTKGEVKNGNQIIQKVNIYAPIIGDETTDTAKKNYEIAKDFSNIQIIFGGNYFTDFLPPSRCWLVWDKGVPKESFFAQVELAWCSKDGNAQLYKYLWSGLCREGDRQTEGVSRMHPTQKPVGMLAEILKDFTKENDNVLDCFGGSGSTLIACEQQNRRCFMIELDPHYCDVILQRWEQFTGKKAEKINA